MSQTDIRIVMVPANSGGMVLPLVLIVLAGLWLLSLALLSLSGTNQRGRRMGVDRLQAELAMRSGLAHVQHRLLKLAGSDDFLIVRDDIEEEGHASRDGRRAPLLYLVRPALEGGMGVGELRYHYHPLFSHEGEGFTRPRLLAPKDDTAAGSMARFVTHPWMDPVGVDWIPVDDSQGKSVARFAYWVEDMEAKIDLATLDIASEAPNLRLMDATPGSVRFQNLVVRQEDILSPGSVLAVSGAKPPLERWPSGDPAQRAGLLVDPWEAFLECHTTAGNQAYEEQARLPYLEGLEPSLMGRPKLNLNAMMEREPHQAVRDVASWIDMALPDFEQRAGGFPEDYVETLAANLIDYADRDQQPLVEAGRYRGVDGQPFLSEVVLHLHFQGLVREGDRWVLKWTLRLFAELWNMSQRPIEGGQARLSYEVNLRPTAVGLRGFQLPFDSPQLLDDASQSDHSLERWQGRYLTPAVRIDLQPDEYRFHEFAKVDYSIECQPQLDGAGQPYAEWFDLVELEHEARGLSLLWNGQEVERLKRIHRDPHGLSNFRTDRRRKTAKACIPSLNYGAHGSIINNPGDSRMSHYFRVLPVGENAYPENISPHRRNIRRRNIYDRDPTPWKARHYGRVMPSQWPDGGHDSATGNFRVTTSDARLPTDPEFWPISGVPTPQASSAPQAISNTGVFAQVTELGRVFDPVMWTPVYGDLPALSGSGHRDTAELWGRLAIWQRPSMPQRRNAWPEVSWASVPSALHGGGHTLRIGRPEHPQFDRPGMRASHLLDLFHCGQVGASSADPRMGSTEWVSGRVNFNTAGRDVLRCMAYGALRRDKALSVVNDRAHDTHHVLGPRVRPWQASQQELKDLADSVADAIIRHRPFASPSELGQIRDVEGLPLFGNPKRHAPGRELQWSDEAAEELFARMHEKAGVRSRHFRVWIVGQAIRQREEEVEILATVRQRMSLFLDPGQRGDHGELLTDQQKVRVRHVCRF